MKKWFFFGCAFLCFGTLNAENNSTDSNKTVQVQLDKHVREQMKREAHYAKTQAFEQGGDYNLSEHQVDPDDVKNIRVDPPMYDFDMDDVYD
jgi:hypothetical protein